MRANTLADRRVRQDPLHMTQVTIENPILNSPYRDPSRHWKFDEEKITDQIEEGRRVSSHFMPIPGARRSCRRIGRSHDRP
jgi:type III restriction enzyme